MSTRTITVEVVYATPAQQAVRTLQLHPGDTVADALSAVAGDAPFAAIALDEHAIGIYGRACETSQVLVQGDRVEIYRELLVDAKAARRRREREQREQREQ